MYLKTLQIKKFRSINEMEISFNKGMNIIIGENNAGKTAVIDALRICLSHGRQWKDIGIRLEEDFYIDNTDIDCIPQPIEFDLIFAVETDEDRRFFTSMIWQDPGDVNHQNIQLHFRYEVELTASGVKKMRWRSWGGSIEGQTIDNNEAQLIYYTYLAPLRNAEQELRPYAKDNKITSLFRDLTSFKMLDGGGAPVTQPLNDAQKEALAAKLEAVINEEDWKGLIGTGTSLINEHLEKADIRSKTSSIHLRLIEYKYDNIVKAIMTRKPVFSAASLAGQENKQRFFDVSQNGLGDNNLIFAAAVLGDLKNRRAEKKEHYYSLLIEEPEAHLHPQRQNTFFNYLNNLRELDLQLFVTSHSPTLTAKSNLDDLIVIQQVPGVTHPFTIKNSELSALNKSYLQKFLDVTKSQLFFSNGTILVEGISEALLLPVLARIVNIDYDLEQNGVEVVNIGGVAFEPFAKLYNSADAEKRLSTRCAMLTDDDRGNLTASNFINAGHGITKPIAGQIYAKLKAEDVVDSSNRIINEAAYVFADAGTLNPYEAFVNATITARRTQVSARAVIARSFPGGNLRTELAQYTFEYELMAASEINYRLMMWLYKKMHPQTTFLDKTEPMKSRALEFVNKLDENKDKSRFAQQLAQLFLAKMPKGWFTVPAYITNALRWVIEGI